MWLYVYGSQFRTISFKSVENFIQWDSKIQSFSSDRLGYVLEIKTKIAVDDILKKYCQYFVNLEYTKLRIPDYLLRSVANMHFMSIIVIL